MLLVSSLVTCRNKDKWLLLIAPGTHKSCLCMGEGNKRRHYVMRLSVDLRCAASLCGHGFMSETYRWVQGPGFVHIILRYAPLLLQCPLSPRGGKPLPCRVGRLDGGCGLVMGGHLCWCSLCLKGMLSSELQPPPFPLLCGLCSPVSSPHRVQLI